MLSTLSPPVAGSGPRLARGVWLGPSPVELSSTRHHELLLTHFKSGAQPPIPTFAGGGHLIGSRPGHHVLGPQFRLRWGYSTLVGRVSQSGVVTEGRSLKRSSTNQLTGSPTGTVVRGEPFRTISPSTGTLGRTAMKAFLLGCAVAIVVAMLAVGVLDRVQQPVEQAFATTGVRL